MRKIKYAKYNRERIPQYQTSTLLVEENGRSYAEKCPLTEAAKAHIASFAKSYENLREINLRLTMVRPVYSGDNVRFDFVLGQNVASLLEEELGDLDKLESMAKEFLDVIFDYNGEKCQQFVTSPEFEKMFGQPDERLIGMDAVTVANLDSIFDNFVISEGKWYGIDYEWVLFFSVPVEYIKYRTLFYFYNKNSERLAKNISEEDFIARFGIALDIQKIYFQMEECFQKHVHGQDREYMYRLNYTKPAVDIFDAIGSRDEKISEMTEELVNTHKELANSIADGQKAHAALGQAHAALGQAHQTIADMNASLTAYEDYVRKHQRARRNPVYAAYLISKKLGREAKKAGGSTKEVAKKILPKRVYQTAVILKHEGMDGLKYALKASKYGDNAMYMMWLEANEKDIYKTTELSYNPLISVVVPVYNVADEMLIAMIESVRNQTYTNWELCLVDDKSTQESVRTVLSKYEGMDKIKITYREENGHICKATNTGFEMATGEFVALLDCDDLLAPNALYEMALKLNEDPDYDFIYSDEDKISEDGKQRRDPFFKPDWSPDTFMSYMYTCHFSMYRKSLIDELGGMREGMDGSQDYDLVLRVMEKTGNIGHIPKILYHWRMRKESTANEMTAKPYIVQSTIKAKEDALERRGVKGRLTCIEEVSQYRVTYEPVGEPLISIIIPSKDNYDILKQCLDSIDEKSSYRKYEIIVVDNGSSDENRERYEQLISKYNGRYYYEKAEFNFSKMCNIGASHARGELLLFLNDDIKVTEPQWLDIMAGQAGQKHTGAVGCKLIYPDTNLIQHAGVVNYEIGPGHAFHKFDDSLNLYWGRNILDYNFTIVTGACLMVDAAKYKEIGGFEETLPVAYNDVDLCFKLVEHGYFNVLRNDVKMYHYESISRGADVAPEKAARLKREAEHLYELHPKFVGYDPCYNPNLVADRGDFSFNIHGIAPLFEAKDESSLRGVKRDNDSVKYSIDNIIRTPKYIIINGWGFNTASKGNNEKGVRLIFKNRQGETLVYDTESVKRRDLIAVFGRKAANAGFRCRIDISDLKNGEYKLAVEKEGKYIITEKVI